MLEISQALLIATTVLVIFALVAYVVALLGARASKTQSSRATVAVGAAGLTQSDASGSAAQDKGAAKVAAATVQGTKVRAVSHGMRASSSRAH